MLWRCIEQPDTIELPRLVCFNNGIVVMADLLYHLLVLLRSRGQNLPGLVDTLRARHGR